jgi:methylglutaconyl-CoA hydratase
MEFITVTHNETIATLALNRPDKRNAMHGLMIRELREALKTLSEDTSRVLIIQGNGENFCAGGDIAWMQKIAMGTENENYQDAQELADLLYELYSFPKPVIVLAHGAVLGGGMGLLTAADIAIAAKDAVFGLPEVKVGLVPAMISPYVMTAIGERMAHYYFLTGERFGAEEALRIGLVQQTVEKDALMSKGVMLAEMLLQNSPAALRSAKQLIRAAGRQKITPELAQHTAEYLAELRQTPEAQEGLRAFLEKRKAKW